MNKTTINTESIDFISLVLEKESYIKWESHERRVWNWKKFKFETVKDEGYTTNNWINLSEKELLKEEKNVKVVDRNVYSKARVVFHFRSQKTLTKYFESDGEAQAYHESQSRKLTNKTEL